MGRRMSRAALSRNTGISLITLNVCKDCYSETNSPVSPFQQNDPNHNAPTVTKRLRRRRCQINVPGITFIKSTQSDPALQAQQTADHLQSQCEPAAAYHRLVTHTFKRQGTGTSVPSRCLAYRYWPKFSTTAQDRLHRSNNHEGPGYHKAPGTYLCGKPRVSSLGILEAYPVSCSALNGIVLVGPAKLEPAVMVSSTPTQSD